ncbi:bifunctional riboflavin kinase/FAD synthetase [Sporomusa sphaeroides]|jgi:riboflavin kinase/FMN adenylyltransferase|uniref:bifunctional riboflavin kinase/FAD synthetase n=1 Tax=Sporomusa sphaeroides TaxID=47679 RepID=UPI002C89E8CC|nr:bifunctional riboflavin kinase/FAD synthetase [Sporomusa sphaeroides]HML31543.1 bifunctional riboflavin kinase/FAD synthetase [Sporomusa sphaeroides]
MEVFTQIKDIHQYPGIYMALGTFDGVHVGHQAIISRTVELAKNENCLSSVFTFSNHPLNVINPEHCPPLIITNPEKVNLIAALGVDILFNIPFTSQLLQLTPESFVAMLVNNLKLKHVIVGENFTYGYRGAGTSDMLKKAGVLHGFSVDVVHMVDIEGTVVSSTVIRQLIKEGEVKQAAVLLGRFVTITGEVIKGDQRGNKLGFPTANLAIPQGLLVPADGVYAVYATDKSGQKFNAVANIGNNPTFTRQSRRIEIHILDFDRLIYGEHLQVQFLDRIRGEIAFNSIAQLKQQMANDINFARKNYF